MSLDLDRNSWKRVRFGDVADRSREQRDQSDGSIERYVAGGHFDENALEVRRWGDPDDGGMGSTFTYAFHPGQVLYVSASWYLRKVGIATFDGVVADKTYVIETRDPEILDQRFLPWILLSDRLHDYAAAQSTGSMNARLLWSTLANFEFDLPPLGEQKRIAVLLLALERHRLSLIVEAAASRCSGAAIIEDLRTTAGVVPLHSVATIRNGQTFPTRFQGKRVGSIPFFKVSDLEMPGNGRWLTNPASWITTEEADELGVSPFDPGTIVTVRVGAALRLERRRMLSTPSLVDDNHLVILPTGTDSAYLWAVLNETRLSDNRNDGVVPSLNQSILGAVPVPDLERNRAAEAGSQYLQVHEAADGLMAEAVALRTLGSAILAEAFGGR